MQGSRTLDNIAILARLSADARDRLAAECRWRMVARGAEIVSTDADSTDVYFLAHGRVRVTFFSAAGREVAFRDLAAGESFGALSAIDGQARSVNVVALEDCVLAVLFRDRFLGLVRDHHEVALGILKSFATLIRDLTTRVVDTTTLTVPQRVHAEVVRLARIAGVKANAASIARFPTHADLASRIGATREAVSRELSRMSSDGLIERKGRDLAVPDFAALLAAAADAREGG